MSWWFQENLVRENRSNLQDPQFNPENNPCWTYVFAFPVSNFCRVQTVEGATFKLSSRRSLRVDISTIHNHIVCLLPFFVIILTYLCDMFPLDQEPCEPSMQGIWTRVSRHMFLYLAWMKSIALFAARLSPSRTSEQNSRVNAGTGGWSCAILWKFSAEIWKIRGRQNLEQT